jgi:hypothetical protein
MEPPPWCLEQWFGDSSYADKVGSEECVLVGERVTVVGRAIRYSAAVLGSTDACADGGQSLGLAAAYVVGPAALTGLSVLAGPPSNVTARGRVMVLLGTIGLMAAVVGLVAYPR